MLVFKKADEITSYILKQKSEGKSIGFVATMGSLHQGHFNIVKRSAQENDITVTSIFVNPTQFNNAEDLEKYPRNTERDLKGLEKNDCDIAFLPEVDEIYPDKVESEKLNLEGLDLLMEGRYRPGHFPGVVTVVKRFFEILHPTKAYFGEKDYQQYLIIKHMASVLDLPVQVVGHLIERNPLGLAMSSRNERLEPHQKEEALIIPDTLKWAQKSYQDYSPKSLEIEIKQRFSHSPLELEYAEFCDIERLQRVESWDDAKGVRIFIAAFSGKVRLIDNESLF